MLWTKESHLSHVDSTGMIEKFERLFVAGNLIFKGTARNFNPCMCGAAKITVAEVEELVPAGELDPNQVHVPGIFVQRIFHH